MRALVLIDDGRGCGPVLVEIDAKRGAATPGFGVVEILFHIGRVADLDDGGVAIDVKRGVVAGAWDVADIAAIALEEHRGAKSNGIIERQVEKAIKAAAAGIGPLAEGGAADIKAGLKLVRGLVGDEPQRARKRAGAEQRALRTRQRLDPLNVIDVQICRAADGGQRQFVEIERAGGL